MLKKVRSEKMPNRKTNRPGKMLNKKIEEKNRPLEKMQKRKHNYRPRKDAEIKQKGRSE